MRRGSIRSQNGIYWEAEQAAQEEDDRVRLSPYSMLVFEAAAWYCPECRQIILPVPEIETIRDSIARKWNGFTESLREKREALETERAAKKREKRADERRRKDPWEVD